MPQALAVAVAARRLAGLRILAAEDRELNRLVLEAFLGSEGAEVVTAGGGLQAVKRIAAEGPDAFDLVLMNIQMPVMDGYEAASRLQALAPRLPVIGPDGPSHGRSRGEADGARYAARRSPGTDGGFPCQPETAFVRGGARRRAGVLSRS